MCSNSGSCEHLYILKAIKIFISEHKNRWSHTTQWNNVECGNWSSQSQTGRMVPVPQGLHLTRRAPHHDVGSLFKGLRDEHQGKERPNMWPLIQVRPLTAYDSPVASETHTCVWECEAKPVLSAALFTLLKIIKRIFFSTDSLFECESDLSWHV